MYCQICSEFSDSQFTHRPNGVTELSAMFSLCLWSNWLGHGCGLIEWLLRLCGFCNKHIYRKNFTWWRKEEEIFHFSGDGWIREKRRIDSSLFSSYWGWGDLFSFLFLQTCFALCKLWVSTQRQLAGSSMMSSGMLYWDLDGAEATDRYTPLL